MSLIAIRGGLAAALTSTGIERIHEQDPDSVNPPTLVIGNPLGTYDDTFDGTYMPVFPVALIVSRAADSVRAIEAIDPYVDPSNPQSVHAALRADPTLGGTCAAAGVTRWSQFDGSYLYGDTEYAGVTFEIEVLT